MKPPFAYYGGKTRIADRIVDLIGPHDQYVEPFAGSLAVLLAKPVSKFEVVNDLHHDLMTFWRVLRDRPRDLARVCALTPHSRQEYLDSRDRPEDLDEVEVARRVWIQVSQGRNGGLRATGWRTFVDPMGTRASMPDYLDAYTARILAAAERIHAVSLDNRPAIDVITDYGKHASTVLYVDPPYAGDTGRAHGYAHEMMSQSAHRELAEVLSGVTATVLLSGYHGPLYDELFAGLGPGGNHRFQRVRHGPSTHRGGLVEPPAWIPITVRPRGVQSMSPTTRTGRPVDATLTAARMDALSRIADQDNPGRGWRPDGTRSGITFTDIFCGFGGSSIGLENAGLELQLGANHWDRAIEVHAANFVHADHIIADVSNYDMRRLPTTDLLWVSPICTELSPAGGLRRRSTAQLSLLEPGGHVPTAALDRTRATFWDVVRATEVHRYKVVLVENVVEAAAWELFDVWLAAMDTLGYRHQFISVSSAHVGDEHNPHAPQWRDRLYIGFVTKALPMPDMVPRPLAWCPDCDEINYAVQSWKRPDRRRIGKYRAQYVYRCPNTGCRHAIVEPYVRPAADAIDWTDLGQRIGDRTKPLAEATMRRIHAGIEQFAAPAMIATNHDDGHHRSYPAHGAPLPTRSTKIGDGVAFPPFLLDRYDYAGDDQCRVHSAAGDAMTTVTAAGRSVRTLVCPPGAFIDVARTHNTPRSVSEPLAPLTTGRNHAVVTPPAFTEDQQPWITVLRNNADVTGITEPLAVVATGSDRGGGHQALTVPPGAFVQKHHGGLDYAAIAHMTKSVEDPMPGVVARPNLSLVIPYRKGRAKPTSEPLHTVATRDSAALTTVDRHRRTRAAESVDVADCRFRMLKPREHGRAQRFPDDYTVYGNKGEQTMGFGNAVSSNVPQWLGAIIRELLS